MCDENTGRWTKATQKGSCSTSLNCIPQKTLLTWVISIAEVVHGSVFFQGSVSFKKSLMRKKQQQILSSRHFQYLATERWWEAQISCAFLLRNGTPRHYSAHGNMEGQLFTGTLNTQCWMEKCSVPVSWPIHLGCWLLALNPLQSSMACSQ